MGGLGAARAAEGPARCWPRTALAEDRAGRGTVLASPGDRAGPGCRAPARGWGAPAPPVAVPQWRSGRAARCSVRNPLFPRLSPRRPRRLIAAGGGGTGRGGAGRVGPSSRAGDAPVAQAPPSPRARTAVTRSGRSPGYSPKYLPAAFPARPDNATRDSVLGVAGARRSLRSRRSSAAAPGAPNPLEPQFPHLRNGKAEQPGFAAENKAARSRGSPESLHPNSPRGLRVVGRWTPRAAQVGGAHVFANLSRSQTRAWA